MKVRAIDSNGDWQFGKGRNDYKQNLLAVAQNIQTRLNSFLGDCFFDVNAGIDWFNLLGAKSQLALNLAINATLIKTNGVTGILQTSTNLDPSTRIFTVNYRVQTIYSQSLTGVFVYDTGAQ